MRISSASNRSGATLAELLVALPLIALLGTLAASVVITSFRQSNRSDGSLTNVRELRHAAFVLSTELRPLRPSDVVALTDTSLEFDGFVGSGIVCSSEGGPSVINVLSEGVSTRADAPASTQWTASPQAGDRVTVWLASAMPFIAPVRFTSTLRTVGSSASCNSSLLRTTTARNVQLGIVDTLPGQLQAGSPVVISRRTRYSIYRSSTRDWYLGRRSRSFALWDVIQPVAGPLASSSLGGLQFALMDSLDRALVSPDSSATRIHIMLRAPRRNSVPAVVDSLEVNVGLRGVSR